MNKLETNLIQSKPLSCFYLYVTYSTVGLTLRVEKCHSQISCRNDVLLYSNVLLLVRTELTCLCINALRSWSISLYCMY